MSYKIILNFRFLMNLPHPPTSANSPQDIISHIQVVYQLQVKSMHSLIQEQFLNSFLLLNNQCGAYSQQEYKHQCCCVVGCILKYRSHRILSPYHSINHQLQKLQRSSKITHLNPVHQRVKSCVRYLCRASARLQISSLSFTLC